MDNPQLILVAGANGYVASHLIPRLLQTEHRVRVLVRHPERLNRDWKQRVEIAVGDVLKPETLAAALSGVHAAYYLIHSMNAGTDFAEQDVRAADNFGAAAKRAGVSRVVYLGGLGDPDASLSEHLRSRHQTGEALRKTGVCVTEFRAAIIVGSGCLSFEMIRYLTERVPTMICPRWVRTRIQPIDIADVISYLVAALTHTESADQIIEIGGKDVMTYGDMMRGYAQVRGLPRWLVHVPVLTPRLSSYWVHWVTPLNVSFARPLVEGLRNEVVVREDKASRCFPEITPFDYTQALERALSQLTPEYFDDAMREVERITDVGRLASLKTIDRGMIIDVTQLVVRAQPQKVYRAFTQLGGSHGWPCHIAWRLRAGLDRLMGGVGMRAGCPETDEITVGDTFDFFRVDKVEPGHLIRLYVEIKLPGQGWLQFAAEPVDEDHTRLVQTAFYAPKGMLGLLYWQVLQPLHTLIFHRMIKTLAVKARAR